MISINLSETIWTVINFFLLYFLLKHFLYTPVIRFMDDRKARMDAKLAEETEARNRIAENEGLLQAEKARSREEAKRILTEAAGEREKRHADAVAQARVSSSKLLKDGEAELLAKREKTAEKLHEAAPDMAAMLAQRLLGEE